MWINFKNFSHYYIQRSISKPAQIIERCVDLQLPAHTLTDNNLNGYVPLLKAKKKFVEENKNERGEIAKKLKINVGMQIGGPIYIAKNLNGYKNLIKIYSNQNKEEVINGLLSKDLISIRDFGLDFFQENYNQALISNSLEECTKLVKPGWDKRIIGNLAVFDKCGMTTYFGIQLVDKDTNPINHVVAKGLRWLDKNRCVAVAESCYVNQNENKDQWITLCTKMKTTLPKVQTSLTKEENTELVKYFKSNEYYIRDEDDLAGLHTQIELDNSINIQEQIEEFDVFSKPILPKFPCPQEINSEEYLKQLCREGWKQKIANKIPKEKHQEYASRVKHELAVLQKANLNDYFLILADLAKFCRDNGYWYGPARGSAAGCMIAYLVSITAIDPILFGLIFERFYNDGRNTADRTSYPDIDFDIETRFKEKAIQYFKTKYGENNVAQIGTFGRSMGRSILTDVLTVHAVFAPADIKRVTKIIPDEAAIADDLNEMKEEEGESSIIRWSLENQANQLQDYCYLNKDGVCEGPYAKYFEQAIRLEGVIRSEGTHAAGLLIWPEAITNSFPTRLDKQGRTVITYGMNEIESVGGVKMDILGINILDKMHCAQDLINSMEI